MAIYRVINSVGKYHDSRSYRDVIHYAISKKKTKPDGIFGGAVIPEIAADAMDGVARAYHKNSGVHLRHSILSFAPGEGVSILDAKAIAREAIKYYKDDYQIVAAVHEDCDHPHIHFVMNTTSYRTGRKYHGDKADYYGFLKHMNRATTPYGVRVKNIK